PPGASGGIYFVRSQYQNAGTTAKAHRRPAQLKHHRADHYHRPGRWPGFALAIDWKRTAERSAIARQGRYRADSQTRRHHWGLAAIVWFQSRSLSRARYFL